MVVFTPNFKIKFGIMDQTLILKVSVPRTSPSTCNSINGPRKANWLGKIDHSEHQKLMKYMNCVTSFINSHCSYQCSFTDERSMKNLFLEIVENRNNPIFYEFKKPKTGLQNIQNLFANNASNLFILIQFKRLYCYLSHIHNRDHRDGRTRHIPMYM